MELSSKSESACIIYLFIHKGSEDKGTLFSFVLQKNVGANQYFVMQNQPPAMLIYADYSHLEHY